MRVLISRVLDVVRRSSREQRMHDEMRTHLELLAEDFVAQGLSPADAELAARKAFGGVDQVEERYRDQRGLPLINDTIQDVRYALRLLRRDGWFTAATALVLALGIGVTSTMATLLYSMNFRGLPFPEAHELVGVTGETTRAQGGQIPYGVFQVWRTASRSFAGLAAEIGSPINLGDEKRPTDQFAGTFLSHNAFALLGQRPVLGRDFLPEDDRAGAAPVAIIGYRVWSDRYGANPSIIGQTVRANGEAVTVIGVMPEGFTYPIDTQVWRPLDVFDGLNSPDADKRPVRVVGRLASGVDAQQAEAELDTVLSTLTTLPDADRRRRTIVMPLNETYFGRVTQPVPMMMLAASVVLLLIACSHAASLWLARAAARSREMSMRAALGASRVRLVRQVLIESVISALIAGILGVAIAWAFVRAFANEVAAFGGGGGMPYWTRFTFDVPIVSVIALICVAAGVVFGTLPAWHLSRGNVSEVLGQGGRAGIASPRTRRTTRWLLVAELAVTMVLLASAGALARSAAVVYRADHVIDLERLWEFRLALPTEKYPDADARRSFYDTLEERLLTVPGVESAALANATPFNARDACGVSMDSRPEKAMALPSVRVIAIGPRYFDTLGLSILRGTRLEEVEPTSLSTAALVNEEFVRRFSPESNAIGRGVWLVNERVSDAAPERYTIVGIAPPLRQQVAAGQTPVVYVPFASQPNPVASILVRGRPDQFADAMRQEVRRLDPDLPLFNLQSLERVSYNSRWIQRIMSTAFSVVAAMAILLSAIGLYSLTSYAASQRTQEIGVRMALGAQRRQVAWLFLRDALRATAWGLVIGLGGAVAVGTVLQSALVDVRANHAPSLFAACLFLATVVIAAALLPARRAARLDPVDALRRD